MRFTRRASPSGIYMSVTASMAEQPLTGESIPTRNEATAWQCKSCLRVRPQEPIHLACNTSERREKKQKIETVGGRKDPLSKSRSVGHNHVKGKKKGKETSTLQVQSAAENLQSEENSSHVERGQMRRNRKGVQRSQCIRDTRKIQKKKMGEASTAPGKWGKKESR